MAARARPGGPDLGRLLALGAGDGLARFPDSTQMGVWTFPSHVVDSLSYEQLVPIGPVADRLGPVTRRQQIQRVARSRLLPVPGTQAALYGTILTAYQLMLATYQPRHINAVLVLTAGVDHDRGDISAATLVHDLQVLYDPRRPVRIVAIMLGRAGDLRALQRIAAAPRRPAVALTRDPPLHPAARRSPPLAPPSSATPSSRRRPRRSARRVPARQRASQPVRRGV